MARYPAAKTYGDLRRTHACVDSAPRTHARVDSGCHNREFTAKMVGKQQR